MHKANGLQKSPSIVPLPLLLKTACAAHGRDKDSGSQRAKFRCDKRTRPAFWQFRILISFRISQLPSSCWIPTPAQQ